MNKSESVNYSRVLRYIKDMPTDWSVPFLGTDLIHTSYPGFDYRFSHLLNYERDVELMMYVDWFFDEYTDEYDKIKFIKSNHINKTGEHYDMFKALMRQGIRDIPVLIKLNKLFIEFQWGLLGTNFKLKDNRRFFDSIDKCCVGQALKELDTDYEGDCIGYILKKRTKQSEYKRELQSAELYKNIQDAYDLLGSGTYE